MIKKTVHRTLWQLERGIDRIRGQRNPNRVIDPYLGYADGDAVIVRGRVLAALRRNAPTEGQSRWQNLRQIFNLFFTDEVAAVEVEAVGVRGMSDEEGYFTLRVPLQPQPGWVEVPVRITGGEDHTVCPALIPDPQASFGVLSDIDDTVLQTGAYSLARNLWTSFTGNALTRKIFPDAVTFMQALSANGRNPIYFISSSPWNLHSFLRAIFDRAGLVKGPMFLRDLGLGEQQFISGTHGDHKGRAIDTMMQANPTLRYVLVGDTGQHDAFVYRDAVARHPGRVAAVVLREPKPGADAKSLAAIKTVEAAGVPVFHRPDFTGLADTLTKGPLA
ncbi:DUF2183 domain-containing protein [Sulfitobacter albidus]|uniref:DUF2183 domain-containing protein n=1 Tax=Sulfitobacter albidus TaxID=2829501 RepID=A0A975JD40_9RHOB|nr:phosphatase domain-containing protein [Sulfitobacter albidus]QUJ76238.1 DUF2183 domain-containing protein [Sulfitobacter albidus]